MCSLACSTTTSAKVIHQICIWHINTLTQEHVCWQCQWCGRICEGNLEHEVQEGFTINILCTVLSRSFFKFNQYHNKHEIISRENQFLDIWYYQGTSLSLLLLHINAGTYPGSSMQFLWLLIVHFSGMITILYALISASWPNSVVSNCMLLFLQAKGSVALCACGKMTSWLFQRNAARERTWRNHTASRNPATWTALWSKYYRLHTTFVSMLLKIPTCKCSSEVSKKSMKMH